MAWPFKGKEGEVEKTAEQSKAEMDAVNEKISNMDNRWNSLESEAKAAEEKQKLIDNPPVAPTENELKLAAGLAITNARLIERDIIDQVKAEGWGHLIPEIQGFFNAANVDVKSRADYNAYCLNIKHMCIGRAAEKGGLRFDGANKTFFIEDKSGASGTTSSGLTHDEENFLKDKLGVDPKKFVENAKKINQEGH